MIALLGKSAFSLKIPAIAAAIFILPASLNAQESCGAINALISGNPQSLRGIGVTVNAGGGIDLTLNGAVSFVQNAKFCDLYCGKDGLDLNCDWVFAQGEDTQAGRVFGGLKEGLDACLPVALHAKAARSYSEADFERARREFGDGHVQYLKNTESLRAFAVDVPISEGNLLDVNFEMMRAKDTGETRISLSLYM